MKRQLHDIISKPKQCYGAAPLYSLNDDLSESKLRKTIKEFGQQGMSGFFIHPRSGLEVPFLTDEWWRKVDILIDAAQKNKLKAWIYDDYNWPSGTAGGKLLENEEFIQPYLEYAYIKPNEKLDRLPHNDLAAYVIDNKKITNVSHLIENGDFRHDHNLGKTVLLFYKARNTVPTYGNSNSAWINTPTGYADLMNPKATDKFIELAYDSYYQRYSAEFGKTISGFFTDEPALYCGFPWTHDLPRYFFEKYGYDLIENLHKLIVDIDDYRSVRFDFYDLIEHLYADNFFGRIRHWCDEHNVHFTGHLAEEENISKLPLYHGGLYRPLKMFSLPGLDALGTQTPKTGRVTWMENPHFSLAATTSIARLTGDGSVMCEQSGGGGWQTSLLDLKKHLNWLFASGINFMVPHMAMESLKGFRKRDFPPSISHNSPWWKFYHHQSEFVSRVSELLSGTRPVANVLVFIPMAFIKSTQAARGKKTHKKLTQTINELKFILSALSEHQISFELLFEGGIEDGLVGVDSGKIRMHNDLFEFMIFPSFDFIEHKSALLIDDYLNQGGQVLSSKQFHEKKYTSSQSQNQIQFPISSGFTLSAFKNSHLFINSLNSLCINNISIESSIKQDINLLPLKTPDNDLIYLLANIGNDRGLVTISVDKPEPICCIDTDTGEKILVPLKECGARGNSHYIGSVFLEQAKMLVLAHSEKVILPVKPEKGMKIRVEKLAVEQFTMIPESLNALVLGPWKVSFTRTDDKGLMPALKKSQYYTLRTFFTLKLARFAQRVSAKLNIKIENFFHTPVFSFGDGVWFMKILGGLLGINLERWSLYEGIQALEKFRDSTGNPVIMNHFPPLGSQYEACTEFTVEGAIDENVYIVYEDLGKPVEIRVNDIVADLQEPYITGWDKSCKALKINTLVKSGKNHVVFKSEQQSYESSASNKHSMERVTIMGDFKTEKNKICFGHSSTISTGDWTQNGFKQYSGTMNYAFSRNLHSDFLNNPTYLTIDRVETCIELWVNKQRVGDKIYPPFEFLISEYLKEGDNLFEIEVTNTLSNVIDQAQPSGLFGNISLEARKQNVVNWTKKSSGLGHTDQSTELRSQEEVSKVV